MEQDIKTPEEFIAAVATKYKLKVTDITGRTREKYLVDIRRKVVRALRNDWHLTYPHIGHLLDDRDFSTIIHLYKNQESPEYNVPLDPLSTV